MRNLLRRAEEIAKAEQRRKVAAIRAEVAERIGGVACEVREGSIVLTGKRLLRRWLVDSALRFVARLGR
ncbi:MAG TPA: hypothetical protein VM265_07830 [Sphingomicrobium sp.]|nr:hypothetical protein [Sphingomicrobium sp.]